MRRWLTIVVAALMGGGAVSCLAAYMYARQSLPETSGVVSVDGLSSSIEIVRDADAIPHIFAKTTRDALFGLGYAHAQDRLWQMEFQRRIGYGRLSEIFGTTTIPQDRFLRTVGFARAARAAWERLPEDVKADVQAYVAGVNAFLASHHGRTLPPEFSLLRFEPEPWSGVDVVVWQKMMAWDLSSNYSMELLRDDLARAVGMTRMQQLMPLTASGSLSIMPRWPDETRAANDPVDSVAAPRADPPPTRVGGLLQRGSFSALNAALSEGMPAVRDVLLGSTTEGLGSNNWVVDGTRTTTGKPLLANDPHLSSKAPSTWYLAHMSAGDFDVIGATLPGTPAVTLGRNRFIAWGMTNVAADVEDLYREQLDASGNFATFRGELEPVTHVAEMIQVKGGTAVSVDVRITRHGPLVSDAINAINDKAAELKKRPKPAPLEPLAFRWTALDPDDTTLAALLNVNRAHNWNEFTGALRDFVAPSQNFVYGDVEGHIGYYAPGRIPIRRHDGSMPTDGARGDTEWTGWIPFEDLPHLYDPPEHVIVTANQRPGPDNYPYLLGLEWPEPYRATRVHELLRATPKLTTEDFARIQSDTVSMVARALLPALLSHAHAENANDLRALDMLRQWDGTAAGNSGAAAIFEAWYLTLAPLIVEDDLGSWVTDSYAGRYTFVTRFLLATLTSNDGSWCDDSRTSAHETCDDQVTAALHAAVSELSRRLGGGMSRWQWNAVHRAVFPHQGLDAIGLLRPILSRSVPNGGDWSTVNVGTVAADEPFEQHSVVGFREIVDLSTANNSRYVIDLGESGHPLSPHYSDFLQDWQAVRFRQMRMERTAVDAGAIGHLRLTPR